MSDAKNNHLKECPIPNADEVNQEFVAPFSGMQEMYALQKGLEIGVEHAIQWRDQNPSPAVVGMRDLLVKTIGAIEEPEWSSGIGNEQLKERIRAALAAFEKERGWG